MSHLLNTHTFLWFLGGDNQLSTTARTTIEDSTTKNSLALLQFGRLPLRLALVN
jgi:PIN domain nuclease of toxin-antitoxin system